MIFINFIIMIGIAIVITVIITVAIIITFITIIISNWTGFFFPTACTMNQSEKATAGKCNLNPW